MPQNSISETNGGNHEATGKKQIIENKPVIWEMFYCAHFDYEGRVPGVECHRNRKYIFLSPDL